jgi:hypothetical protein
MTLVNYMLKQELGIMFKSVLKRERLLKLVGNGSSKGSPRQRTGGVANGGNMGMLGGLSCQKMQIGGE